MNNTQIEKICIFAIIAVLVAPWVLSQYTGLIMFGEDSAHVGDTIGGCTAPIVGLVSIFFLYLTLREQMQFNKDEKSLAYDDQFKTTFFTLLQVQRDITEHISGEFTTLNKSCLKEYHFKSKEGFDTVSGIDFFIHAKQQLAMIYKALEAPSYYNNYNAEELLEILGSMELYTGNNLPEELERENEQMLHDVRYPQYIAYINGVYNISESTYKTYNNQQSQKKKNTIAYSIFYLKYNQVGHYFRHLYRILKFIEDSEKDEIQNNKRGRSEDDIHAKYMNYAQFIQAQMSRDELLLLFHNSFMFPKMQTLLINYKLLSNLAIQNLIDRKHNCIKDMELKDLRDYLKSALQ